MSCTELENASNSYSNENTDQIHSQQKCLNGGTNALPISPSIAEGQINLCDEHPNPSSPYLLQDNGGAARAGC